MNKQIRAGVVVLAAIVAVFFSVLTGGKFLKMAVGAADAEDYATLEEMEGKYIAYTMNNSIVSYAEEYYSGDPSRVSKIAYIVYDEKRQAFLKIVIPERKKSKYAVNVSGSLMLVTDTAEISKIQANLQDEIQGDDEEIGLSLEQTKWYVLEDGYVDGASNINLWICAVTILLNIVFFLICLISLLRENSDSFISGGSNMEQLLGRQRMWLEPWCEAGKKNRSLQSILWIFGATAVVTVFGFAAGGPVMEVLTMHVPIGLCIGELCGVPILLSAGRAFNPGKILKEYQKNLNNEVPRGTDLNALAGDLLGAGAEWTVIEKGKDQIRSAILGERYWIIFCEGGLVRVVDSEQIAQMKSEEVSGQVRSSKVRMNYVFYAVNINYRNSGNKKDWDISFSFNSEDNAGKFMVLARKRLGDRALEVIQ